MSHCLTCSDRRYVGGFLPAPCPGCNDGYDRTKSAEAQRDLWVARADDLSAALEEVRRERDAANLAAATYYETIGELTAALDSALADVARMRKHVEHNDEEYRTMKEVLRAEHEACQRMRPVYEAAKTWRRVWLPYHHAEDRIAANERLTAAIDAATTAPERAEREAGER